MARLLIVFPLVCNAFLRSYGHFMYSSLVSGSDNQWKAPLQWQKKPLQDFKEISQ